MEQINLNIIPDGVMPVCHASQFDKNRTIRFNLNQNGSVYTLAGTETITCKVRKPDDTESTINVANTSSSYVDVTFGFSDTDLSGYAMCELKIVNGAQTIGSRNFLLNVEADAYDGSVFEERSASGEIASFETNFIDNLTECIVDIDAVQDLHGYEKPWAGGAGKNKLPLVLADIKSANTLETWSGNNYVLYGVTFTILTNESDDVIGIKVTGTASADATLYLYGANASSSKDIVFSESFIASTEVTGSSSTVRGIIWGTNGAYIDGSETTFNAMTVYGFGIRVMRGYSIPSGGITFKPMLRLATSASGFAPYSNICPISGWSECNIHKSGINLWDEVWEVGSINDSGINAIDANKIRSKNYIPIIPNTDYFIVCPSATKNGKAFFYDNNQTFISSAWFYGNATTTTPSNACYMRFRMVDAYGTTYNNDISINYPNTDTSYHSYNGGTDTISLGQTVYGGSLNVTTGELTITHAFVDLGTLSWNYYLNGIFYTTLTGKKQGGQNIICDKYKTSSVQSWTSIEDKAVVGNIANTYIYVRDTDYSDAVTFKTAMSGVQLVYELATPTTIQLTPTEVSSLLNSNNIFADTGDIEVKYLIEVI